MTYCEMSFTECLYNLWFYHKMKSGFSQSSGCVNGHATAMYNQLTECSQWYYQWKPAGGRLHPWIPLTNTRRRRPSITSGTCCLGERWHMLISHETGWNTGSRPLKSTCPVISSRCGFKNFKIASALWSCDFQTDCDSSRDGCRAVRDLRRVGWLTITHCDVGSSPHTHLNCYNDFIRVW